MWQDIVFAVGTAALSLSLIPCMVTKHKPHVVTNAMLMFTLMIFAYVFFTLGMVFTASVTVLSVLQRLIIWIQINNTPYVKRRLGIMHDELLNFNFDGIPKGHMHNPEDKLTEVIRSRALNALVYIELGGRKVNSIDVDPSGGLRFSIEAGTSCWMYLTVYEENAVAGYIGKGISDARSVVISRLEIKCVFDEFKESIKTKTVRVLTKEKSNGKSKES